MQTQSWLYTFGVMVALLQIAPRIVRKCISSERARPWVLMSFEIVGAGCAIGILIANSVSGSQKDSMERALSQDIRAARRQVSKSNEDIKELRRTSEERLEETVSVCVHSGTKVEDLSDAWKQLPTWKKETILSKDCGSPPLLNTGITQIRIMATLSSEGAYLRKRELFKQLSNKPGNNWFAHLQLPPVESFPSRESGKKRDHKVYVIVLNDVELAQKEAICQWLTSCDIEPGEDTCGKRDVAARLGLTGLRL